MTVRQTRVSASRRRPCFMLGMTVALLVLGVAVARCDWPTFRGDAARSGVGDKPLSGRPAVAWRAHLGGSVDGSPILVGGVVYVGNNHGIFAAVDASSGEVRWQVALDGAIAAAAASSGDRLLVPTAGGFLYCVSTSGKILWRVHAWDAAVGSPLVIGSTCYWGTMDGIFHATAVSDGAKVWEHKLAGGICSAASSDGKVLFIGDEGGAIWALSPADGKVVWQRDTGCPAMAASVVADGNLFVPLVSPTRLVPPKVDYLVALDRASGEPIWQVKEARSIFASPVVTSTHVIYASVEGYLSATLLRCVDKAIGKERYKRPLGGVVDSSAAWAGDMEYFGGEDGCLYAVRISDGIILSRVKLAPKIFSSPALEGGNLYVGASDGYLYCMGGGAGQ